MSTSFFDKSEWISQAEAARIRGVTRQAISKLAKKGKLKTIEIGGHILINKKDLLGFEPEKGGRPPKKNNE